MPTYAARSPHATTDPTTRVGITPRRPNRAYADVGIITTFATLSLKTGIHPTVVSERLGHATVGITLDLYSHVTPSIAREAADAVAGTIWRRS